MAEPRLQLERVSLLQRLQPPQQVRSLLGAKGAAGGLFSGVTQQQLQHISQRTFHQPLATKRRPLPSPTLSSGLLFSSRPGSLALLILDFFLLLFFCFHVLAQKQAMKLKPQENKRKFEKKKKLTTAMFKTVRVINCMFGRVSFETFFVAF